MSLQEVFESLKAGRGQGNWGHRGRKGKRGGSLPGKSSSVNISRPGNIDNAIKDVAKKLEGKVSNTMASTTASGRVSTKGDKVSDVASYLESRGYRKILEKDLSNGKRAVYESSTEPHNVNIQYDKFDDSTEVQAFYLKDWRK